MAKTVFLNLTPDQANLSMRFAYDPAAIELIKLHLSGRRWSTQDKVWTVPFTETSLENTTQLFRSLSYNIMQAEDINSKLAENERRIKNNQAIARQEKQLDEKLFEFVTTPMEHQRKALAMLSGNRYFALFMEQGTGKTKVMLDFLKAMKKNNALNEPAIVVAPTSVVDVWQSESAKHQPSLKVQILEGSVTEKAQQLKNSFGQHDIVVMNYESTWRDPLAAELLRHRYGAMVLDESTRIMHHSSKQAKQCIKVGKLANRRFILTGTPAPNGPLNLYNQLRFLDPTVSGPSFYAFRDRYVVLGGYQNHQVIGYKNQEELQRIVGNNSFRVKKDDCLDLPPKIYEVEKVDLEPKQRKIYDQLKEELIAEVEAEKFVSAPNALARLIRLRQISSGFAAIDDGLFTFPNSAKIKWLREFLQDHKEEKVIVWGSFIKELDLIQDMLNEEKIKHVRFDGETSIDMRSENIKSFQGSKDVKVFLSTAKAGGLGITLTSASVVVFMSNEFSGELRMQAEDRAHRLGQKSKVLYIDVVAKNTVDSSIYKMLLKKKQLNDMLSAGSFRSIVEGIPDEEAF